MGSAELILGALTASAGLATGVVTWATARALRAKAMRVMRAQGMVRVTYKDDSGHQQKVVIDATSDAGQRVLRDVISA